MNPYCWSGHTRMRPSFPASASGRTAFVHRPCVPAASPRAAVRRRRHVPPPRAPWTSTSLERPSRWSRARQQADPSPARQRGDQALGASPAGPLADARGSGPLADARGSNARCRNTKSTPMGQTPPDIRAALSTGSRRSLLAVENLSPSWRPREAKLWISLWTIIVQRRTVFSIACTDEKREVRPWKFCGTSGCGTPLDVESRWRATRALRLGGHLRVVSPGQGLPSQQRAAVVEGGRSRGRRGIGPLLHRLVTTCG